MSYLSDIIGITKNIDLSTFKLSGTVAEFNEALIGDDFVTEGGTSNTFATIVSPALVTPNIGDASASSVAVSGSVIFNGDTNLYRSTTNTLTTDDNMTVGGNMTVSGTMTTNKTVISNYNLTTTSTTPDQILGFASCDVYRTMELTIQGINATSGKFHATKLFLMNNGSSVTHTEYGTVSIGGVVASYNVDYSSPNMRVLVTPGSATSTEFLISAILTKI